MKTLSIFLLSALFLINLSVVGQVQTIKVWPGKIPGAIDNPNYKEETAYNENKSPRISKVTDPTLSVYLPSKEKAKGTAVIICPGGGYGRLAIDHEGYAVAEWLSKEGIVAIILKYRLPSDDIMKDKSIGPLQDAQEAIRIVRRHSKEWNINPEKIGIMGFSAGGHLASTASTHYNDKVYDTSDNISARPNFSILIYPVISMKADISHMGSRKNLLGDTPSDRQVESFSNDLQVTSDTPPAFLVHSTDDNGVLVENSVNYLLAMKKNKVPAELHIYERGGHGYGMGNGKGTQSSWTDACIKWLIMNGLI